MISCCVLSMVIPARPRKSNTMSIAIPIATALILYPSPGRNSKYIP